MKSNIMNLNDIRKKYGLEGSLVKKRTLDDIRREYKLPTAAERAEEKSKLVQYGGYSEDSYRPYEQVKAELDAVTARRNTYDNEKAMRDSGISGKVWQNRYGEDNTARIGELEKLIADENKRIEKLTREATYSRMYGYNDLANNEDFGAKSVYDKNAKATVANQLYRQVNNPDLPLTNEEYSDATREITRQMTADEVKIFNYIYNTQGDKAAQEYFDYLKTDAPDPLNSRRGKEIAGNIDTDVGRAIYGGIAAVDNTTQGVKQLFTSEAVKPTVAQYASAQAAEDVETKVGKFAYDLSATVGNMAPSILASTAVAIINPVLGKAAGSTLMGAASAGNTYTDAINSGMTPRQAMKYGAMVGASEAALESVLGGISKLGANPIGKAAGKLVSGGKFAKAIGAVDNAFIRAAAKLAGSMAGEIAEEELQLFLEPLFKTMATDEKYDAPEWEEIVYTALISAASAGLFEAPGNIAEAVQESRQKKAEKILKDAIAEHEKQSEAQRETDAANADFANKVSAENAAQTANDTTTEKAAEIERKGVYSEMVANYADSMDAAGQNAFVELYDGSVEPDVYVREMQDAYDAGRRGEELAASETAISQEQRQLAYKAGEADAYTEQHGYGLVRNDSSATLTGAENDKMLRNLDRLGKDLKVKIQFADSVRGGTARGSYRNGVVTIARGSGNAYMTVAKHEISHHLEKTAPKAYAAYQTYALETVAKGYGKTVDALVQDRIALAARHGDTLTAAEARAEIAADFTELIFANENTLRTFVEANSKTAEGRNLLQRLADAIRRFIASLKKTEVSVNAEAASKLGLGSVIDRLERAEMLFREVLTEGGKQTTGVSGDGKAQASIVRTSKMDYSVQLHQIEGNKLNGSNSLYAGMPSTSLVRAGLPDEPFAMNQGDYRKARRESAKNENRSAHDVPYAFFKDMPRHLSETPLLIDNGKKITMITDYAMADTKGQKSFVVVGVWLHNPMESYYVNQIKSAYPLDDMGRRIVAAAEEGKLVVVNKNKVEQMLTTIGIQPAEVSRVLNLAKTNITQPDTSVNSQQSAIGASLRDLAKQRDSDYLDAVKRGDTETAQKMVDEAAKAAGYNYKLYHQTNADFNVFDVKHKGAGTTDDETPFGIFMKPTSSDIGLKGQKQMPLYAKIEKPLIANNRGSLMYELRKSKKVEDIQAEIARVNADYNQRVNQAGKDLQNYLIEYREKHPNEPRKNIYNDKMFNEIYEKEDSLIEEWGKKIDALSVVSKEHINDHLKREGYDGVIIENDAGSFGRSTKTYIALDNTQVKSADPVTYDDNGNVIPLSERFNPEQSDIRYSMGSGSLSELAKKYGEIAPGENPAREVHLPKKTEKNKNVSETIRTILEGKPTPDMLVPDIETMVEQGVFSYEAYGDDAAVKKARDKIATDAGWEDAKREWFADVRSGKISKDLTTMGWVLYNNAANIGAIDTAITVLTEMVGHQRNAAQALQATRILKKLDPESQLYAVVRSVDNLKRELEKKYGDKAPDIKIDEVFARRLLEATDQQTRDAAMRDIYREVGRQMPSTFIDKWNAWRYLAMLGNPRTHFRNIAGNALFMPIVWTKSFVAAGIEAALISDQTQRTKAMPSIELMKLGFEDFDNLPDGFSSDGKYNDRAVANKYIQEGRQIFNLKNVEGARKISGDLLEKEDRWFMRPHYALALAQYCKANNVPTSIFSATDGADKFRADNARKYAFKEAEKATYKDANAVSKAVKKLSNTGVKGWDLFADAVLPFRSTPANILVRAVEYSPVGLVKSISADLVRVQKGKITAAQMIDNLAAGLTGTALLAIGVLLSRMGLVRGINGEEEEERKFQELQGYQGYALVGDKRTYTIDWLAPQAIPFFIGVNLSEMGSKKGLTFEETMKAVTNLTAPMLEMSCLQGINDLFESASALRSEGGSAIAKALTTAATSYITQALPTSFGQVERVFESKRETTYTDKNKWATTNMQYLAGKAMNKTLNPLDDVSQIPYIDAWGRETSTGNRGVRAFNNLVNPGYSAKIRTSPMEKELQRLYDATGEASVLPDRPQKYITVKGTKIELNKNQYVKYAKVRGQTAYDMLTKITENKQYAALDEQSKVDLISKVYSYANEIAKAEVTSTQSDKNLRYQLGGWQAEAAATSKATGIPVWKYVLIYNGYTEIKRDKEDGEDLSLLAMEYIYSYIGLSDEQRQALYEDLDIKKTVRHYDRQRVAQELKKMRAK